MKEDYDALDLEIKLLEKNYNKKGKYKKHNSKRNVSKFLKDKKF